MLSTDVRFTGFSTSTWLRLLHVFGGEVGATSLRADRELTEPARHGTLIVIENDDGSACAAFHSELGSIVAQDYGGRGDLGLLCERHLAQRAVAVRRGALEDLTERAATRVLGQTDYAGQWLALLAIARDLEQEGLLHFHPPRKRVPLPSTAMLMRSVDLVLPDEHAFLAMLWEGAEVWTALVLRRRRGEIDLVAGPELIADIAGPLGGDYRRDQRTVSRAISRSVAPLHLGVFAQRAELERLLRNPAPGAWAKAIALRDVIIDPAPPYVHVAVGADALRASARKTSQWLGGLDVLSAFTPMARYARDQVSQIASVTGLLGFNPLHVLAQRLRDDDTSKS